jgi:tyrosyl-tRNA synthetase
VRDHFTNDEKAKGLLEQVKLFKSQTYEVDKTLKRMRFNAAGTDAAAPVSVVFAPQPTSAHLPLGELVGLLRRLRAVPDGHTALLWIEDWGAFVNNCLDANPKTIDAAYTLMLEALAALDPETMAKVTVVKQSEAILTNPSDYWISVINVGRTFQLETVQDAAGHEQVGEVIGALMHVGDMMSINPAVVVCATGEAAMHSLGEKFYTKAAVLDQIDAPQLLLVENVDTQLKKTVTEGVVDPNSNFYITDDPKAGLKKKMKQAFCEPGNVEYNPPLVLAQQLGVGMAGSFTVGRSAENGGDSVYTDAAAMEADFVSGALHPGDLKASCDKVVMALLEKIVAQYKGKAAAAALKTVLAYAKKAAKAKK